MIFEFLPLISLVLFVVFLLVVRLFDVRKLKKEEKEEKIHKETKLKRERFDAAYSTMKSFKKHSHNLNPVILQNGVTVRFVETRIDSDFPYVVFKALLDIDGNKYEVYLWKDHFFFEQNLEDFNISRYTVEELERTDWIMDRVIDEICQIKVRVRKEEYDVTRIKNEVLINENVKSVAGRSLQDR